MKKRNQKKKLHYRPISLHRIPFQLAIFPAILSIPRFRQCQQLNYSTLKPRAERNESEISNSDYSVPFCFRSLLPLGSS